MISQHEALMLLESETVSVDYIKDSFWGSGIFEVTLNFQNQKPYISLMSFWELNSNGDFDGEVLYEPWAINFLNLDLEKVKDKLKVRDIVKDESFEKKVSSAIKEDVTFLLEERLMDYCEGIVKEQAEELSQQISFSVINLASGMDLTETYASFTFFKETFVDFIKKQNKDLFDKLEKLSAYYEIVFYNIHIFKMMKEREDSVSEEEIEKQTEEVRAIFEKLRKVIESFSSMTLKDFLVFDEDKKRRVVLTITDLSTGREITDVKVVE